MDEKMIDKNKEALDSKYSLKSAIDKILDEECADDIYFFNDENELLKFEQVALIVINDDIYSILYPLDDKNNEGMALIFLVNRLSSKLELVEDQETINLVSKKYHEILRK